MNNIKSVQATPPSIPDKQDEFWQHALRLSEQRLSILASNIANADTPNYKARDIDFRSALQQAMATGVGEPQVADPSGTRQKPFLAVALYRIPTQGSVDGNTVDMDVERTAFAEQAIRYEAVLQKALDEYKEMSALFKNMVG